MAAGLAQSDWNNNEDLKLLTESQIHNVYMKDIRRALTLEAAAELEEVDCSR